MGSNKLLEEKALGSSNHGHKQNIHSLEERVSVFLQDFDQPQHPSFDDDDDDLDEYYESSCTKNNHLQDSMERTMFWESQEALLQEVLERYNLTGSKLRQEINRIIEMAKKAEFCNCFNKLNSNGCNSCFRKRVVDLLCQRGFNATLCISKWKHTNRFPGGKHEYIEVIVSTRGRKKQIPYLIELEFKDQFEIAKASNEYRKLTAQLPNYYVGKADYLNAIVCIVCDSAKRSMKEKKIHMGPWRKRGFIQMKWSSSSSRRSVDESSGTKFSLLSSGQAHHESCLHFPAASALTLTELGAH